jgi:hypothetical protein
MWRIVIGLKNGGKGVLHLRNKSTNIRQTMLKLKTHSGFYELFRF